MNTHFGYRFMIVALALLVLIGALPAFANELGSKNPAGVGTNNLLAAVPGWQQSNTSGFGTASNTMISALQVFGGQMYATTWNDSGSQVWRTSDGKTWSQFTPSTPFTTTIIYDAKPFGSYLYIGTYLDAGGEIWRTNGTTWERVATDGLGDANNLVCAAFAEYSNALYVAVANLTTGVEIWRSTSGNSGSWTQVNTDGFGGGAAWDVIVMDVYSGYLYVGIARSTGGSGSRAELWRTNNGTTWNPVFTDGLGDANNTHVAALAEFDGNLYLSFRNTVTGGQVWRSSNGTTWNPVFTNGLGVTGNTRPYGLYAFENSLYLVFSNYGSGAQIWRSADGTTWNPVMQGGWGDGNNKNADYFDKVAVAFNGSLYIGSGNDATGGQIWQMLHQIYLPMIVR